MKNYSLLALLVLAMTFSSCELVGDIFEVGVYTGLIIVAIVVIIIIWIISKFRRRR